jgi:hypothetical protein
MEDNFRSLLLTFSLLTSETNLAVLGQAVSKKYLFQMYCWNLLLANVKKTKVENDRGTLFFLMTVDCMKNNVHLMMQALAALDYVPTTNDFIKACEATPPVTYVEAMAALMEVYGFFKGEPVSDTMSPTLQGAILETKKFADRWSPERSAWVGAVIKGGQMLRNQRGSPIRRKKYKRVCPKNPLPSPP